MDAISGPTNTTTETNLAIRLRNDLIQKAVSLLCDIVEHKQKNAHRNWEAQFYPISRTPLIRPGKPDYQSPEVQLLIQTGLVQFWPTCSNERIPDDSLRMLDVPEARAKEIITLYVNSLSDISDIKRGFESIANDSR